MGETVFVSHPDNRIRIGKVTGDLEVDNEPVSLKNVATLSRELCGMRAIPQKGKVKICPGDLVKLGNDQAQVLGAFLDYKTPLSLLVIRSHGPLQRVGVGEVTWLESEENAQVSEALRGFAELNELLGTLGEGRPCTREEIRKSVGGRTKIDPSKCAETPTVINGDDSPNKEYFQQLLAKGQSASIDEFLRLWYPERSGDTLGSPYFECEDQPGGHFRGTTSAVPEHCRPDVLYSWGPVAKRKAITRALVQGQEWDGHVNPREGQIKTGTVFGSISPASTYGYGLELIRFKIRKETPYGFSNFGAKQGELTVRNDLFHDFSFNDAEVVESWSYGTPEIYDEIIRDILRYRSGKRVSVYISEGYEKAGMERLYAQAADKNVQDEAKLKRNLLELIRQILAGEGKIFYPEDLCYSRKAHYATEKPWYVNPIRAEARE